MFESFWARSIPTKVMSQGPSHKKTMTFSQSALLKKDREARYNARIKRTLDELVPISEKITLLVHASANRAALKGLKTGMRLEETKRRMGDRTRTGSSGYFTNIVLQNPHRSMTFYGRKGERIEILLYLRRSANWMEHSLLNSLPRCISSIIDFPDGDGSPSNF